MKRSMPFLLVLVAGVILAAPARAAESTEGEPVWRAYPLHYLDVREAGLLIESRVPEMLMQAERKLRYEVLPGTSTPGEARPRGYLQALAEDPLHDRIAAILAEADHPPQTRMFQLVLLEALSEAAGVPELSSGARAALDELRGLLPFKGYRLIDSALARSSGRTVVSLGEGYDVEFAFRIGPSREKPLEVERFVLYSRLNEGHPALMQTSFSAGVGETVVVGTSTPQDKRGALVVLMTAVE